MHMNEDSKRPMDIDFHIISQKPDLRCLHIQYNKSNPENNIINPILEFSSMTIGVPDLYFPLPPNKILLPKPFPVSETNNQVV